MNIAIINYNAGNVQSVLFCMERLGINAVLTDDFETIQRADKVIFPGVGEARSTMSYLRERRMDELIRNLKQPVLGICVGAQLLCAHSEENDTDCIGVFPNRVKKFIPTNREMKVPHMGWNTIQQTGTGIFTSDLENEYVYYVHSYYPEINEFTMGMTEYAVPFSAGLQRDNFYATQFHPEKSGKVGERILENFFKI
ncbi:MAG: imidazole glycerol phosphate synthase subunit HisH [Saprospiraceae bacterium]